MPVAINNNKIHVITIDLRNTCQHNNGNKASLLIQAQSFCHLWDSWIFNNRHFYEEPKVSHHF